MLKIEQMVVAEMPLGLLAQSFRDFYHREPWNEYLRCPSCGDPDCFGSQGRYEDQSLLTCPVCGTQLEEFWSDERVTSYFQDAVQKPGFVGVVGKNDADEIVAWTWGYHIQAIAELADLDQNGIYVDVIGVLPEYREDSLAVFIEGHAIGLELGYKYFVTRTHVDAAYVHRAMTQAGYSFLRRSIAESDREYWILVP